MHASTANTEAHNAHPTAAIALCMALEKAIDYALQHDPASRQKLVALAGRCLSLELTEPRLAITLTFTDGSHQPLLMASPFATPEADCALKGKSQGLIKLMNGPKHSLAGSDLRLSGHTGFLMELLDITQQLEIDWEAMIEQALGTIPMPFAAAQNQQVFNQNASHLLAGLIRNQAQHVKRLAERAPFFIGDFLTEEINAVPSKFEIDAFNSKVDDTQDDVARLEARLQLFQQRVASSINNLKPKNQ
ncbi:MAG: SCP2 sterol-binding domain-containing protein [Marinagarivorans sp.]|nr:SCP2 sterol-binding domain-containing protein [Marinagarivorans sp.]